MAKNLYEEIITCYGYPIELMNNQQVHFINETIQLLTIKFMIQH